MTLRDKTLSKINTKAGEFSYFSFKALEKELGVSLSRVPYSIRILLETALRNLDNYVLHEKDVVNLANYNPKKVPEGEFPFKPSRVILQDFTGVPCIVDLAALRNAMVKMKGDPKRINPLVRVDLVIDHSIQVDYFASNDALDKNMEIEFQRNMERYEFLKWGQHAFNNFGVVPPGAGIVHQVNMEYLAGCVLTKDGIAYPDSLVGTDSHTPMINGIGVLGWGVGGIEAEAVMLGQPLYMLVPEVIGFRMVGKMPEGATATDLVLNVTHLLRKVGVVEKFVEFFGPGLSTLSVPDRATIGNMSPENGSTSGYFPVDNETLNYLRKTGRSEAQVDLVERYYKEQGLFRTEDSPIPEYTNIIEFDLSTIEPSLAGPKRPQDRILMKELKTTWNSLIEKPIKEGGFGLADQKNTSLKIENGYNSDLRHGDIIIAAITSCTNTSNPAVLVGAGILAKKAVEKGLKPKSYVKTSLAPGSRVVTDYLNKAGLSQYLDALGFQTVGYGCTTCIGNSGPIADPIVKVINEGNLVASAVLSGNRNFEGRISPHVKANFLMSPPLVVAYAIAGTVNIDLTKDALGKDKNGNDVFLKDIWPSNQEILDAVSANLDPSMFAQRYNNVRDMNEVWNKIKVGTGEIFEFDQKSTYVQEPPFFIDMPLEVPQPQNIKNARVLLKVGDSFTTDHISPAGSIAENSPAGQYLKANGVAKKDFNSYGSRRGNDRVMTRGTFANVRVRNQLVDKEGGYTKHLPSNEVMFVFDAAMKYKEENVPLVVLAGAEYGTGSSRDWAAKGTLLLGVKAVIATSFERIHRSNLVGMGVLPLVFVDGQTHQSLGLTGEEIFSIEGIDNINKPHQLLEVTAQAKETGAKKFKVMCRLDNQIDIDYFKNGGILQTVLRHFIKGQ